MIFAETVLTARLWDNAPAQDLLTLLPLTLTFSDLNDLEKVAALPRELSVEGVPAGDNPVPADIGYYAPWGNLVFYYGDVGYFNGIMRIGHYDSDVGAIAGQEDDFTARIERAD